MSLAFVRGIHWWLVNSPHKWPVTRKMFPFDDVIMDCYILWSIFTWILFLSVPLTVIKDFTQVMAWCQKGDIPLLETILVSDIIRSHKATISQINYIQERLGEVGKWWWWGGGGGGRGGHRFNVFSAVTGALNQFYLERVWKVRNLELGVFVVIRFRFLEQYCYMYLLNTIQNLAISWEAWV